MTTAPHDSPHPTLAGGRRGRAPAALGAIAALALLVSCTSDDGAPAEPDESSAATTSPASPASPAPATPVPSEDQPSAAPGGTAPPFPTTTRRQLMRPQQGSLLVLTDVRVGEHPTYDRTVLEFSGPGRPGWVATYVDRAVQDGSGTIIDLEGEAILDLYASGTTAPAPGYYDGPARLPSGDGPVSEVYVVGTFEGYTQVFVGVDSERGSRAPFRVFALRNPTRLVVDVAAQ